MQFPAAGYLHSGGCSPWELRRSHALRGIGRRTRDQSTTRGAGAQRPSARSREGIKRQGADFLSRPPVLLSPLARLPVPSCCFLIGCRKMAGGVAACQKSGKTTFLTSCKHFNCVKMLLISRKGNPDGSLSNYPSLRILWAEGLFRQPGMRASAMQTPALYFERLA